MSLLKTDARTINVYGYKSMNTESYPPFAAVSLTYPLNVGVVRGVWGV